MQDLACVRESWSIGSGLCVVFIEVFPRIAISSMMTSVEESREPHAQSQFWQKIT
jgi:hypothetical protein